MTQHPDPGYGVAGSEPPLSCMPTWLVIWSALCMAAIQWAAMGAVLALMFGWEPWK